MKTDYFPNSLLDTYVKPIINKKEKVALIILDCLRYDQAKVLIDILYKDFNIKLSPRLSFLPTTTEYSRNSIFSGLFPSELSNHFPSQWNEMNSDESKLNKYEQKTKMINVGVIGYGYWGPNLVRNFSNVKIVK